MPWTTPIKLVPELYRTKTIIDQSGNIRNWAIPLGGKPL